MSEYVRADALSGDPCTCFEPLEEHFHPIFCEWLAGFREEQVIFSSTSPFSEFFFIRTMFVQVVGEITQTVLSKCHPSLLCSFPHHRHDAMFAIEIREAQVDEFRDADAGIIEEPENGAIADRCSLGIRTGLMGRSTGE